MRKKRRCLYAPPFFCLICIGKGIWNFKFGIEAKISLCKIYVYRQDVDFKQRTYMLGVTTGHAVAGIAAVAMRTRERGCGLLLPSSPRRVSAKLTGGVLAGIATIAIRTMLRGCRNSCMDYIVQWLEGIQILIYIKIMRIYKSLYRLKEQGKFLRNY